MSKEDVLLDELNKTWIQRCKANDRMVEIIDELHQMGYVAVLSTEIEKQFVLEKRQVEG